jgi:hypothetical protein
VLDAVAAAEEVLARGETDVALVGEEPVDAHRDVVGQLGEQVGGLSPGLSG